jgi:hypothetical protein
VKAVPDDNDVVRTLGAAALEPVTKAVPFVPTTKPAKIGATSRIEITRPEIVISTDEMAMIDAGLEALTTADNLYRRGGYLVHVVDDDAQPAGKKVAREAGSPRIAGVAPARVQELLSATATWMRVDGKGEEKKLRHAHPPGVVVKGTMARGEWPTLRPLRSVAEAPTLRPDGSVIDAPGYDASTGVLYRPTAAFPAVPRKPSRDRSRAACDAISDTMRDFPFAAPAHRSTAIAAVLSVVGRFAYRGPAPLFLIDANTRGSGKSLLGDVIAILATGHAAARMAPDDDDKEMRKRMTSIVMAGDRLVLIDNVAKPLGGEAIDAALTGDVWHDRKLSTNEMVRLPLVAVWMATGNNIALRGDTSRRAAHIRLASPDEHPEERTGFQHADLRGWLRAERPRLLVEAVTLLAGYIGAGAPSAKLPPWGSFEGWSDLIRGALVWVGEADPGDTREELRRDSDHEAAALRSLVAGWSEIAGNLGGRCTVRAVLTELGKSGDSYPTLRTALGELTSTPPDKLPTAHRVGFLLRKFRERVVGGKRLVSTSNDRNGVALWSVVEVGQ